jgi:hypothetical protein
VEDQVKKSDEENNVTFKLSRKDMEINQGFGFMSTHIDCVYHISDFAPKDY